MGKKGGRRYGRVTVKVTGTLLLPPPDEAVTVTVDVPAGVPVAVVAGGGESLLVQLPTPITQTKSNPAHMK